MKSETIHAFTERAIRGAEAGKLIPPVVYLPRRLRGKRVRLTEDNLRFTVDGPTVAENHVKIAGADPVGFLIAIMNGQPIPEFRVTQQGAVDVYYEVPPLEQRIRVAEWLANKATLVRKTSGGGADTDNEAERNYQKMIAGAAERALAGENADAL